MRSQIDNRTVFEKKKTISKIEKTSSQLCSTNHTSEIQNNVTFDMF